MRILGKSVKSDPNGTYVVESGIFVAEIIHIPYTIDDPRRAWRLSVGRHMHTSIILDEGIASSPEQAISAVNEAAKRVFREMNGIESCKS